jgi:predicted dehydrogenase
MTTQANWIAGGQPRKVALVGFGKQMRNFLVPSILLGNTAQIVAVDSRADQTGETINIGGAPVPLVKNLLRSLDEYGVTHVVAATNPSNHYEVATACCDLRLDCFVEKSPCTSSTQLLSMIEKQQCAASRIAVGLNYRYAALLTQVMQIRKGHFGERPGTARIRFRGHVSADMGRRYGSWIECVLLELGVHAIDLSCNSFGADHLEDYRVTGDEDGTMIWCRLRNRSGGDVVHLHIQSASGPFESSIELVTPGGGEIKLHNFSEIKLLDPQQLVFKDSAFGGKASHTYIWPARRSSFDKNGYLGCLNAFFDGRGPTLASLRKPYETIDTLIASAESRS